MAARPKEGGEIPEISFNGLRVNLSDDLTSATTTHLTIPKNETGSPNFHIIVSIRSGIHEADAFFVQVVQPILARLDITSADYQVHHTTSDHSITDFTTDVLGPRAQAGIAQTVLLLSGDGGVADIINVLLQSSQSSEYVNPKIGLLAFGTGNALANSYGLSGDATRGLGSFLNGDAHSLPIFTAVFSPGSEYLTHEGLESEVLATDESGNGVLYGAVVCSWGLHASLVGDSDTAECRKYGSERFSMAAKALLAPSDGSKPHVYKGRITLFKKDKNSGAMTSVLLKRREHIYVLATLVSNLEETLRISPRSQVLDGQLRLVHFGPLAGGEFMRIMGLAFAGGKHVEDEAVGYEDIDGLRIDFDEEDGRWRRVCVDGKIVRVGPGGWVEVRRESRAVVDIIADSRTEHTEQT